MSTFEEGPNVFVDPEDSQLVKEAKQVITDPVSYSYTEV
jgi:hypothetical protein